MFAYLGLKRSDEELYKYSNKIKKNTIDTSDTFDTFDIFDTLDTFDTSDTSDTFDTFDTMNHFRINPFTFFSFCIEKSHIFQLNNYWMMFVGDIINYNYLIKKYEVDELSFINNSYDFCVKHEIILYLIQSIGIELTLKELEGEFSFIIFDENKNEVLFARDKKGSYSLFVCLDEGQDDINDDDQEFNFELVLCSYTEGLEDLGLLIEEFPAGSYFRTSQKGIHKY